MGMCFAISIAAGELLEKPTDDSTERSAAIAIDRPG
jgi:hypothetical protein